MTALVLAYFGFRQGCPPANQCAHYHNVRASGDAAGGRAKRSDGHPVAIAIGLAALFAMGVFQIQDGVVTLFGLAGGSGVFDGKIFVALVLCLSAAVDG